jgi:hypothetical protein
MKPKVGDRVKLIPGVSRCSMTCGNRIYKVIEYNVDPGNAYNPYYVVNCKCKKGVWPNEIVLVKDKPDSEIECLDRFKENFEEGV